MTQNTYPSKSIVANLVLICGILSTAIAVFQIISYRVGVLLLLCLGVAYALYVRISSPPETYSYSSYVPDYILTSTTETEKNRMRVYAEGSRITQKMLVMYILKDIRTITLISVGFVILWSLSTLVTKILCAFVAVLLLVRLLRSISYNFVGNTSKKIVSSVQSEDTAIQVDSSVIEYIEETLDRFELSPIELIQLEESESDSYELLVSKQRTPKLYYAPDYLRYDGTLLPTAKAGIMHEIAHLTEIRYNTAIHILQLTQIGGLLAIVTVSESLVALCTCFVWLFITKLIENGVSRRGEYFADQFSLNHSGHSVQTQILSFLQLVDTEHNPFAHPDTLLWKTYLLFCTHPPLESRINNIIELNRDRKTN